MSVRPRILIADNDVHNVQLLSDICASEGLEVLVAQDGDETLRTIQEDPPDLVLLDVMMPRRDGFEVLQALRQTAATRTLPVILVTAVSDDDSIRKGYQLGANDYLTKPFKVVELVARIRTLLAAAAYVRVVGGCVNWDVGDRGRLMQMLDEERRHDAGRPLALLMFQVVGLDDIKRRHDDALVTRALRRAAMVLRPMLRGMDGAFLLPPDRLAFVLVNTAENDAVAVAERLLRELRQPLHVGPVEVELDGKWALSMSSGEPTQSSADMVQRCVDRLGRDA